MKIIAIFVFAVLVFASVVIVGMAIAFWFFPETSAGKTFFRIFVDGDYDGQ